MQFLNWTVAGMLMLAFWFSPEAHQHDRYIPMPYDYSGSVCDLEVDAGPDTNVCAPGGLIDLLGSITGDALFFEWTPHDGLNNPFVLNPTADITGPITYTLTAYQEDPDNPNLVFNGDFSGGNVGFITDYTYVVDIPFNQLEMYPEGTYTVIDNPNLVHDGFAACGDHTGGGDMMVVNGAASFQNVWCQTITVTENTFYNIAAWVASVNPASPAQLQFSINGNPIGDIVNATTNNCEWIPFNTTWESGGSTSAEICILNLNTALSGNDFAIDDISMVELCSVEDEVEITIYDEEAPEPIIDGLAFLCEGEAATYTATFPPEPPILAYQWSIPSGAIILSGQGTSSVTVLWEDTQIGELCLGFETRCDMNSACFEVEVGTIPEFPLISGPTTLCPGEIAVFYTPEIDPDDTYDWTIPSNLTIVGGEGTNEIELEWNGEGEAEICLEVNNICGFNDNCAILTLHPEYLTLFDTTLCEGNTIEINGTTYGNGYLTGTETFSSINGCDSIVEVDITEVSIQEVMTNTNLCPGDSVFLEGAFQTEEGIYTDTFPSVFGCDSIVITELIITAFDTTWVNSSSCNPADTGMTIITYTQGFCDSTVVTTVSLSPTDTTDIVLSSCSPADTGLTAVVLTNQFGCDSLIRTHTLLSPTDSIRIIKTSCDPSQVGEVTENYTNIYGCDSVIITTTNFVLSDTTELMQYSCSYADTGTVSVLLTNSLNCDSLVITHTLYGGSDTTFLTQTTCNPVDSGFSYSTLLNQHLCDSIVATYSVLLSSDTTYLSASSCNPQDTGVSIQGLTNLNGCDSTIITTTALNPIEQCTIVSTIDIQQPLCFGDTAIVTISTLIGLAPYAIEWQHEQLGTVGSTTITTDQGTATLRLHIAGTYYLETNSANGLTLFDTIMITDIPALSVLVEVPVDQNGFGVSCFGDSTGMVISTMLDIGTPPYTYLWSDQSETSSIDKLGTGMYTLTVTDANGCTTSGTATIDSPEPMEFELNPSDISCFGAQDGSIRFNSFSGGVMPWLTSINQGAFSDALSYASLGQGQYTFSAMDQNGCMVEDTFTIDEPEPWSVSLGADTTVAYGNAIDLAVILTGNPTGSLQTNWSDGICHNCMTRTFEPSQNTSIGVVATDANGCISADQIQIDVFVDRNIYIPNVFSPNGDQINDLFMPNGGSGIMEIESMVIYDRWGNIVYQAEHFDPSDLSKAWDGTMNGRPLNPGVYVYTCSILFIDGKKELKYGDISLLR